MKILFFSETSPEKAKNLATSIFFFFFHLFIYLYIYLIIYFFLKSVLFLKYLRSQ